MREIVGTERNILGDQGNMEHNFWEHGNSVKVNFGDHLNSFLTNKETTVNFCKMGLTGLHGSPARV